MNFIQSRYASISLPLRVAAPIVWSLAMWRFLPFYIALIAAPLLFGGIKPESQATLGILLSLGLILTTNIRPKAHPPRWTIYAIVALVAIPLLTLLPLPLSVVKILSPERARLAVEFPVDGRAPEWLTLSVSPARTVQRIFEISLALAALVLARRHATLPGAKSRLAVALSIALILLAASDIWSREHGRGTVLNLWAISWGKGYGTFANHNHFANWIYVASVFLIGWTLREILRRDRPLKRFVVLLAIGATAFALTMAFLSASRSGAISFIVALGAFAFLLRHRFQSRQTFALAASLILLGAITIGLLAAEPVIERLRSESAANSLALKTRIWTQTLQIATKFPIFGAGPGSFTRVYNHYKTAHGDGTFHHAENEFVELPLEIGFPFAILACAVLVIFVYKKRATDSPTQAGILAALFLFLIHACVEFVAHIPSNLILAATLLGTILPTRSQTPASANRWLPLIPSTLLLAASLFQIGAWHDFWQTAQKPLSTNTLALRRSLALWPFAVDRNVARLRLVSEFLATQPRETQFQLAAPINDQTTIAILNLDPLNWNARLEQCWFQLAYTQDRARAITNAWSTVRLNPLQGQIPIRFARHFRQSDPELALQFLTAVHADVPANHEQALDVAWTISADPAQLWKLTPNTTNAILNLVRFAQRKKLYPVAFQACQALENRIPPLALARHYLEARHPDQTLRVLANLDTLASQSLRIQALHAAGKHTEAIAAARNLFASPSLQTTFEQKLRPTQAYSELLTNHHSHPTDPVAAVLLAEKIAVMSPVNLDALSNLSRQFPSEPRIAYLHFRAQSNNPALASAAAANLVNRLIAP